MHIVSALDPAAGLLLHLAGDALAGDLRGALEEHGFRVLQPQVYRMLAATSLSEDTVEQLAMGEINGVILLSPRTAQVYATLMRKQGLATVARGLTHFCLSPEVARRLEPLGNAPNADCRSPAPGRSACPDRRRRGTIRELAGPAKFWLMPWGISLIQSSEHGGARCPGDQERMANPKDETGKGPPRPGDTAAGRRPYATLDLQATEVGQAAKAETKAESAAGGEPPKQASDEAGPSVADRVRAAAAQAAALAPHFRPGPTLSHLGAGALGALIVVLASDPDRIIPDAADARPAAGHRTARRCQAARRRRGRARCEARRHNGAGRQDRGAVALRTRSERGAVATRERHQGSRRQDRQRAGCAGGSGRTHRQARAGVGGDHRAASPARLPRRPPRSWLPSGRRPAASASASIP